MVVMAVMVFILQELMEKENQGQEVIWLTHVHPTGGR